MREHTQAKYIILVGRDAGHPEIIRHCDAGGDAIVLDEPGANGRLCIQGQGGRTPLLALREIPATWNGLALYNAENAMYAAAIAMGLGLDMADITEGLRQFSMSMQHTPGRLNVLEGLPFQVIFDFAHNAHGIKAFCNFTDQLQVTGRRRLVMAAAGDRSADEIEESAASVAGHFDHFICRDPYELRGRSPGVVPELLRAGLVKNGVAEDSIEVFTDKEGAILRALEVADSGDLLVVFAGKYYVKAWDTVEKYKAALRHDRPVH
jgi:cyanophycin synthetase